MQHNPVNKYRSLLYSCLLYSLLSLTLVLSFQGNAYGHRFKKDTLRFRLSVAEKKNLVLSDSALNEIGLDSLLDKIQNVHLTLDEINNATSVGFNIRDMELNFAEMDSNFDNINENLTLYNTVLDVKNLQMFDVLLADLQNQVTDWRNLLIKYNKELSQMSAQMNAFKKDTVLKSLIADSAFRSLYLDEITDLKGKWKLAKLSVSNNQSHIKQWLAIMTNEYFETIDLQNRMRDMLRKISIKSLGKEYDYLWNFKSRSLGESNASTQLVKRSLFGQIKILGHYFRRHWDQQFWMLVCFLIFGLWIFLNFRRLEKLKEENALGMHSFTFIQKVSLLPSLVVLVNLAPFFDIHPPTAYVEITEFILVVAVTFLNRKTWPRQLFIYWLVIVAFYISFALTGILFTPTIGFRVLLLVLNLASLVFGIFWYIKIRKHTVLFSMMIRVVSIIYIILNLAAILCNLLGRLSLAKIFSVTAIYGLTQIIGLTLFIEIVLEAFHLQTMVNQYKGGLIAKLNFHKIQRLLNRLLMIISICIWTIIFCISLNIYNYAFAAVVDFLGKERKMGNTNFQIGNILLFVTIIYISNLLQTGVGSLLGKSESNWDPEVKKNGSRLAMTRLVLIVLGFLIAVAASGLPIDKITIVLGALGVGIGLGLQGIVNNLVSGVVLIFEQPFRIGDYIQLGDKKGRVLDIGIRSSKLVMEEGAELIMPNADLLSGMVVNWTIRNDNVRIDIPISIEPGHTFEEIQKIILEELKKSKYVVLEPSPEILLVAQSEKGLSLDILIWINDVHKLPSIKSEVLKNIYSCLATNQIKVI